MLGLCARTLSVGAALLVASLASVAQAGPTYSGGVATWYGTPAAPSCLSRFVYPGFKTIAMNKAQYGTGEYCGACVHACFRPPSWWLMQNGRIPGGQICVNAVVNNLCPGCWPRSFDIGSNGNGRWPLTWKYVPCPKATPVYRVISANPYYGKLKVEGLGRILAMHCNGYNWERTYDGCFISRGIPKGGKLFSSGVTCVVQPQFGAARVHTFDGRLFH